MLRDSEKYIGKMFSNTDLKVLIVPLIIEQFLAIMVGMSDTVMVSFAGEAAVSGVSLVDMVNNVIISLLAALATGGAVVISQFIGARRHEDACMAAAQLELMAFVVAVFISIFSVVFAHPLISVLFGNIDSEVFEASKKYLIITAISFPMLAIYNSGAAIYRSIGDSKTSMKVSILMNIINIVGNYIGVFILHLGVAGVAIPSVISRSVAAVVITILASKNKDATVFDEKDPLYRNTFRYGKFTISGRKSGGCLHYLKLRQNSDSRQCYCQQSGRSGCKYGKCNRYCHDYRNRPLCGSR